MINRLKKDIITAMKEKDAVAKGVLQVVRANITNFAKEKRVDESAVAETDILGIIAKEVKQQKDSLRAFEDGGREDLVMETRRKIGILEGYLPEQLTEEEVKEIVQGVMSELGITEITNKDKGNVMKILMQKIKGKADGQLVNKVVSSLQ